MWTVRLQPLLSLSPDTACLSDSIGNPPYPQAYPPHLPPPFLTASYWHPTVSTPLLLSGAHTGRPEHSGPAQRQHSPCRAQCLGQLLL
ncbi:unnamed protein product [Gadus morhua 'NCC']